MLSLHEHVQRLFDTWTLQSTSVLPTHQTKEQRKKPENTHDKAIEVLVSLGMEPAIAGQFINDILAEHPNADTKELIGRILNIHQQPVVRQGNAACRQSKAQKKTVFEEGDLRRITKDGRERGICAYEALKAHGFIKSPSADFAA
jgi:hypothetical protein